MVSEGTAFSLPSKGSEEKIEHRMSLSYRAMITRAGIEPAPVPPRAEPLYRRNCILTASKIDPGETWAKSAAAFAAAWFR